MINIICIIIKHLTGLGHTELARVVSHPGEWAICTRAVHIQSGKAHNYSFYHLPMESIEINITQKHKIHTG